MEPERNIEKLLRAYAEKRRAEAGDPLKLHPATRRVLQDEAASTLRRSTAAGDGRRAPKPGEGGLFLPLLALCRRKLVFAVCVVAITFLGASIFLPALGSAKRKAQSAGAMNRLREIGVATRQFAQDNKNRLPASLDEVTNALGAAKALTDPATGKPFVYAGGGKRLDGLQSSAVLAYSLTDKEDRPVLFADGHVETVASSRFVALTNQKSIELALADNSGREKIVETPPVATPVAPAISALPPRPDKTKIYPVNDESKAGELALTARRSPEPAGRKPEPTESNAFKNNAASAQATPVLQSFQVQQNGDAISVVDRDGSVYHGSVQSEAAMVRNGPAPADALAARDASLQSKTKAAQSAGTERQAAQNYFFRVAGTNRTLKQNVVFTGNFLANSGAPQTAEAGNSPGGFGGGGAGGGRGGGGGAGIQFPPAAANASQQTAPANPRIVGTAVVAGTNQIEINALPAKQ